MSLSEVGVWKVGVWKTTVWAAGVWRESAQSVAQSYSGGYPDPHYKTRKQRDAERRKLRTLIEGAKAAKKVPEVKAAQAAKKVAEVAQAVEQYQKNRPDYQAMMLAELRADKWLPDTRSIEIQFRLRQEIEDEEDVLILLLH